MSWIEETCFSADDIFKHHSFVDALDILDSYDIEIDPTKKDIASILWKHFCATK